MHSIIEEGSAKISVVLGKISKKLPVFYNPVMKLNRDVSVLLLQCFGKKNMQIGSPLAGSGVREIRFFKELKKGIVKSIAVNDYSLEAVKSIKKNLVLNKIKSDNIKIFNKDANLFLLESSGFDYIDIDPFGSPNPFLDSAVKRLGRGGILAVTATDAAALTGTYPEACKRKYWANPLLNYMMHEIGIRILIRKVQLIGAQYEKALKPLYSYYFEHYFRVFFICEKGKKAADEIINQHGEFLEAGPMWLGGLWDEKLASKIEKLNKDKKNDRFFGIIKDESKVNSVGFYDVTEIAKKYKLSVLPKKDDIIRKIKVEGFLASETHFRENSIRSTISEKDLVKILKNN
jgi:tRNA (guanine26-N2/guanine27-N2)-dimethyltransferase